MAGENGQKTDPLERGLLQRLQEDPYEFDFFQALRALENHFSSRPKIGRSITPSDDPVRFGQKPDLAFATSTLEGLEYPRGGGAPRLFVRFFGLLGPNGPLPANLTEFARERTRNVRDSTIAAFYNVFHHRMLALFYRAWSVNNKAVDFDRPAESRFAGFIGSLFGLGTTELRKRDSIPDNAKLFFAGRLAAATRNAGGLEAVLAGFFEVPAEIRSLVGHWLPVPERYFCRLGQSPDSATLGSNALLGSQIWDVQNRFHIRLGPMNFSRFCDFLPNGSSFGRLNDWVAFYTSGQLRWDVRLLLEASEVPPTRLGAGSLLGWTTWLQSEPARQDSGDLVIDQSETRSEKHYHTP